MSSKEQVENSIKLTLTISRQDADDAVTKYLVTVFNGMSWDEYKKRLKEITDNL